MRAGNTVQFKRISHGQAMSLYQDQEHLLKTLADPPSTGLPSPPAPANLEDLNLDPRLHTIPPDPLSKRPGVVFRQAGDSAILVEFGDMVLDFAIRARIHAFETEVRKRGIPGLWSLAPCIRSTMVSRARPR